MKVEHNCDVCGTPFMSDSRNLARGWGRCCSKTCAAIKRESTNKTGRIKCEIMAPSNELVAKLIGGTLIDQQLEKLKNEMEIIAPEGVELSEDAAQHMIETLSGFRENMRQINEVYAHRLDGTPLPDIEPETSLVIDGKHIATLVGSGNEAKFITWNTLKPSELMFGNIVKYKGKLCCVTSIQEAQCTIVSLDYEINKSVFYNDIEPVTLTDEILRDWCGLIETYGSFSIDLPDDERIDVRKDGTAALWASDGCTEGHCLHVECKYLHQLQNLYFALTGEELEIKLPKQ